MPEITPAVTTPPTLVTLDELVTDYLRLKLLRPEAAKTYRSKARTVVDRIGLRFIHQITVDEVVRYRDALLRDGRSVATWNTNRRHLIALWRHAIRYGMVLDCPWSKVGAGREPKTNKSVSTVAFKTALDAISASGARFLPHAFWRVVAMTLALTAMRRSQLIGLIWSDVIFDGDTSRLLLRVETSKTGRQYKVPLCRQLRTVFEEFHRLSRALWGEAANFESSQVFHIKLHLGVMDATSSASSLTKDALSQFFRRLARRSGVRISTHRLRHRTATILLQQGADVRTVQDLLGHTSVLTTMRYVWPDLAVTSKALDQLVASDGDLFSGGARGHDGLSLLSRHN